MVGENHLSLISNNFSKRRREILQQIINATWLPLEQPVKGNPQTKDPLTVGSGMPWKSHFGFQWVVVVAAFWARVLCHLVVEEARFRMKVTLGVILIRSLAYTKHVPGRLRSGSWVALN